MNRHAFIYLCMSLAMVAFVFGSLPLAAAEMSDAPVGMTETFTPAPTDTPVPPPTETPVPAPTETLAPTPMDTPIPTPTETGEEEEEEEEDTPSQPSIGPTDTPAPAPTETLSAPVIVGLPNTGGGAPQSVASPWTLGLFALVIGSLGALVFGWGNRTRRPTRQ